MPKCPFTQRYYCSQNAVMQLVVFNCLVLTLKMSLYQVSLRGGSHCTGKFASIAGQGVARGRKAGGNSFLDTQPPASEAPSCWMRCPHTSALGHCPLLPTRHAVRFALLYCVTSFAVHKTLIESITLFLLLDALHCLHALVLGHSSLLPARHGVCCTLLLFTALCHELCSTLR